MFSTIAAILANLFLLAGQDVADSDTRVLQSTSDSVAMGRCLNGLAGARNVQMQCTVGAQGRPERCVITNPSPAVMRNERVFQCMASRMQFSYSDGSSAEGEIVQLQLGGQTILSEEKLRQAERRQRDEEEQRREQP